MGELLTNRKGNAEEMPPDKRTIPGGYITKQLIDEIRMANSEIAKDIDATTRVNVGPQEFYRIAARIALNSNAIDKALNDLKSIFE